MLTTLSARGDVTVGADWTPLDTGDGFLRYDGFADYADGPNPSPVRIQAVQRNGNTWLQYNNSTGQYWGQLTGQSWANSNLTAANIIANPHVEFDVDLSQYTWGRLFLYTTVNNDLNSPNKAFLDLSGQVARNFDTQSAPPVSPMIQHVSLDLTPDLPAPDATSIDFEIYLQPNVWGYNVPDGMGGSTFQAQNYTNPQTMFIDNVRLTGDPLKINASWNANADGTWSGGPWFGGTPNGAGHTANFFSVTDYNSHQATIGAHTITVDVPVTVGVLNFNNPNGYTLAAGAGSITLQGATGVPASITSVSGSQLVSAPLTIASDATINVYSAGSFSVGGSTLTLSNLQPGTAAITKRGGGLLAVNNMRASSLAINEGKVAVLSNGTSTGVSRVGGLTVGAGAMLDLSNNHLIVDYTSTSPLTDVRAQIISGYAAGAWNGTGITSSAAAAAGGSAHKTALGYGEASATLGGTGGTFAGQTVDGTTVLVRYTYSGDANLDGKVDTLDFNSLAGNFGGTGRVWTQADFNYDGVVDTLDFNNLAANFGQQLADGGGAGALVPEPASSIAIIFSAGLWFSQRKRKAAARH